MRTCNSERAARSLCSGLDILVIEDSMRHEYGSPVRIAQADQGFIITTKTEEAAFALLRTTTVDMIYNLRVRGTREEAERFKALVSAHYPGLPLIELLPPGIRRSDRRQLRASPAQGPRL